MLAKQGPPRLEAELARASLEQLPPLLVFMGGEHLLPCLMVPGLSGLLPTGSPSLVLPTQKPANGLSREQAAVPRPSTGWQEQAPACL